MISGLFHFVRCFHAQLHGTGLLLLRLWVGYEFVNAGWIKLQDVTPPHWFAELNFPFPNSLLSPTLNWTAAGWLESLLGCALIFGIFSRLASWALIYITFVAVYTVHFDLGWAGWNQIDTEQGLGFKVPLMLGLMLFTIISQGAGRFSLDHVYDQYRHLTR